MGVALIFAGMSFVVSLLNLFLVALLFYRMELGRPVLRQQLAPKKLIMTPGVNELATTLWMLEN
jgi:hypothetical protein